MKNSSSKGSSSSNRLQPRGSGANSAKSSSRSSSSRRNSVKSLKKEIRNINTKFETHEFWPWHIHITAYSSDFPTECSGMLLGRVKIVFSTVFLVLRYCYCSATVVFPISEIAVMSVFSYYIMILGTGVKNASGRNNLIPFQTRWTKMTKFMVRKICQTCPPQRTLSLLRASANDSVQIQFVKTSICTICTSGKRIFILTVVYRHATFVSTYI